MKEERKNEWREEGKMKEEEENLRVKTISIGKEVFNDIKWNQKYNEAKCLEENENGSSKCKMIRTIEELRKKDWRKILITLILNTY